MKKLSSLILCLTVIFSQSVAGSEPKYPVSDIPAELLKDAGAVIRRDHMRYTILQQNKAKHYVSFVVTIFKPNKNHFAEESIFYDKLCKITSFKGNVYDADGKLIKKLKSSDIIDQSAFDGYSLYSDNRFQSADLSHPVYPYTVEFEYEVSYNYINIIPETVLVPEENVSVQQVSYELVFPSSLKPRYKLINIDQQPKHSILAGGIESLQWNFENLKTIKIEPCGPTPDKQLQQIIAAPSYFEYEGYKGNMSTWNGYGQWVSSLLKGRGDLPEEAKAKVREIVKPYTSIEDKTRAIYQYLQNRTRYVNISLGIGGFQPFHASTVDQVGYGDCKALSNYTVAMLKEAGIESHYAFIKAGNSVDDSMFDFTCQQFNHAIVAVPNVTDTIWLECTSQSNPFGYAGRFTGDRKALIFKNDGAEWVNTPRYPAEQNVESRTADIYLTKEGDATAKIHTEYKGLQFENNGLDYYAELSKDEQKKWIQKYTQIATFDVNNFSIVADKQRIPKANVDLDLSLRKYSSLSGTRSFVTLNLMNRFSNIPEKFENRKTNVVLNMPYVDEDVIKYHLPDGVVPEHMPSPVQLKSRFGEYESSVTQQDGVVIYKRRMKMLKGEFPPESYNELIDFLKSVTRADLQKLILQNKT